MPRVPTDWDINDFSIELPAFREDPMYFYMRLQQEVPVLKSRHIPGHWTVTRHRDCVFLLSDHRLGVPSGGAMQTQQHRSTRHMLNMDPPDHTRLRKLVSKAFTPKGIERFRARIFEITNELIDAAMKQERVDFVSDFAFQLPAIVLAELLGVPSEDRYEFKRRTESIIQAMGADVPEEIYEAGLMAQEELCNYFDDLLERRRTLPADDLITGLLRAEEEGGQLTGDELVGTCILFITAGHETTSTLLSGGMLLLLEHPDVAQQLRDHPDALPTAIDEMMRLSSPVQRVGRRALETIELDGNVIETGDLLVAVLAVANRDPAAFTNPQRFDITRNPNPHLGFGRGIHYCLGAPLARLEGEIAFRTLLERQPKMRLAGAPVWHRATMIRTLKSLPMFF